MKFFSLKGFKFLINNSQLIYGVVLIVLIPTALVANTVIFINNTQSVMDVELTRSASLANSLFSIKMPELLKDETSLQKLVEDTVAENEELYSLDVLIPEGDYFKIIASLDREKIGDVSKYLYNTLAWRSEETGRDIAFPTYSNALSTEDQSQTGDERFWVVVNPVTNSKGEKVAIVSMKISSKIIDDLTNDNVKKSLIILSATVIIIVLLLVNNMRLFQYALLFRKLKEVDEMKDEFISMASHELRAPIVGIRGYLQMVLDKSFGELPKEAEEKLQLIMKQSDNLHDLVEDLLDVSRIEQSRMKLSLQPLVISLVLDNAVKQFEQQAINKGLKLDSEIESDLPQVMADDRKLKQILTNLVSNAIKYTNKGKITISAELQREKEPMIKIKVADTGIGMSAKDRERLFEKFYRVRNIKTDKISGTGLGLWITKELVKMMNGEIYVDSIEGTGTEVSIILPIQQEKQE
ncbi:HAMP domain-containing histidine kinase [Patescibacteria group bacterium]|nr:HAMP domain-containing histidine kinase [Patescibacteria group bacterium]MBU0964215.1 HAMP domain-containing histidine kinase [Patescibacteria group bacterium]